MFEAKAISKRFGGDEILRGASLRIEPGEVVGLVGMNGSGKTTLLEILSGKISPDSGEVWVDGVRVVPTPWLDTHARVFRSHQEPRLFFGLSVRSNILMGKWALSSTPSQFKFEADKLPPDQLAETLSIGQRRRVVLDWVQARIGHVKYFLLDEPASGADDSLVDLLLGLLTLAREHKCGVLLVEHRDGLLKNACDRTIFLRDGVCENKNNTREISDATYRTTTANGLIDNAGPRLSVHDLGVVRGGARVLSSLSFKVSAGEVVVLTGPNGCGKSTALRAIYGDPACMVVAGRIAMDQRNISSLSLRERMKCGIQLVPQNGTLFSSMTVEEALHTSAEAIGRRRPSIDADRQVRRQLPLLDRVWQRKCGLLSGGERRLVSLARALLLKPNIALLDEPLAGVDAHNTNLVLQAINQLTMSGAAVVVAEQLALASRVNATSTFVLGTNIQIGKPSQAAP